MKTNKSALMVGLRSHESASCRLNYSMGVPAEMRDRLRELSHLSAADQGKGHGSELMRKVCDEADQSAIVLLLTAKPELFTWYERFGFYQLPDSAGVMARPVHTQQKAMN
jgi:predicted GNAT family N-acyltransferase